jgi:enoyl-CoA hydratase/carnithine racemase
VREHFADDPLLPVDKVLALGAETWPGGDPAKFNMAVMGMRLAQRVNGVSVLHGQVSRQMFAGLWPGFDTGEVPIGSVTNGVHTPTWVAPEIRFLAGAAEGDARGWDWDRAASAPGSEIWETRHVLRARLVAETRRRLRASWRQRGASDAELTWIDSVLDEHVLTIGFARRVPSYKRLTLMLNDPEHLARILNDPERPVQIIVAGKAHPADDGGKALIQQMVQFADSRDVRRRIVFLPDYDMAMARTLVQGCDVWLNNPLRPLEACGTSGMKAALNGGLNCSVRDGWWDEWYDGGNGWEIPSADGVADAARRDELEASALYELLAKSVAPMFYDRDADGIAQGWVDRIRHTLRSLGPKVQAERMVRDYVSDLYVPAAVSSRALADASGYGPARELAAWKRRVAQAWPQVRIEHVEAEAAGVSGQHLGSALAVHAMVALGGLGTEDVTVEVVYGRPDEDDEIVQPEHVTLTPEGDASAPVRYSGEVPLGRPGPFGYTVRVLPRHPLLASRAELGLVTFPHAPAGMTNGDLRLSCRRGAGGSPPASSRRVLGMGEFVRLEVADGIGTIRLDRPPVNALNDQVRDELADAAREAEASEEIRAVILYGGEKVFAAGADIKQMAEADYAAMVTRSGKLQDALSLVAGIPKPVVAAITGYALGGGLELALCADFRVAGSGARLGQPEILLGVIPGAGGTQRLPRLVGPAKAKDIIFTGRMVPAAEAHAIGLVDLVAPDADVYTAAREMVQRYASGPALALRAAKLAVDHGLDVDLGTALQIERAEFAALFGTQDQKIGMRSFLENGPGKATFTGR